MRTGDIVVSARSDLIQQLLVAAGLDGADQSPLAGDASFRTYERIEKGARKAVLMNAPPPAEDVRPFVAIGHLLCEFGLSAPQIFAGDCDAGLLLLEDLGDDLFFDIIGDVPEIELYTAAVDLLSDLQSRPVKSEVSAPFDVTYRIPDYSDNLLMGELRLLTDWYCPLALGSDLLPATIAEFEAIWRELLPLTDTGDRVLVLRDYHAQNLIWLPERDANRRVGLLDFQDAVIGPRAYDLVSLLEDARRDVSPETVSAMIEHYCARQLEASADFDRQRFLDAYAILGAQRNTKIIGIFTRLYSRDGKAQYLDLIPRVWKLLEFDLMHPKLYAYKAWLDEVLPLEARTRKLN